MTSIASETSAPIVIVAQLSKKHLELTNVSGPIVMMFVSIVMFVFDRKQSGNTVAPGPMRIPHARSAETRTLVGTRTDARSTFMMKLRSLNIKRSTDLKTTQQHGYPRSMGYRSEER